MHLFDASKKFLGGNAIVGGGLPLAVGLALADRLQQRPQVTVCFFGEGAVAEGEFHESMNLAALWQLPVLFVCENNLYAMGTPICVELSHVDIAQKGQAYKVASGAVDGMDVLAVEKATRDALTLVRQGQPYLLECRTFRFRAHSMFDAELYRSKSEVESWKRRDPINLFVEHMQPRGLLNAEALVEIQHDVDQEIAAAVEFAESGTWEPVEELTRFVYSEGVKS
jgi:pyruvate dehydrogenase E1 component alpha subunit/2-oxoisovalerate dehydrogenase E1 component